MAKVFISHSSKDREFVVRLVNDLKKNGVAVWYDKHEIRIGDDIVDKIEEGLQGVDYFCIVLSPSSIESRWVKEELNSAKDTSITAAGTFVLPLLLSDCAIPPLLKAKRFADFRNSYDVGLAELLSVLNKDNNATNRLGARPVPFPETPSIYIEDVTKCFSLYLYSKRFKRKFRLEVPETMSADSLIDHIVESLGLPWNKRVSEIALDFSFSYAIIRNDKAITLDCNLKEAGVKDGDTIYLRINATYKDELEDPEEPPGVMYEMMSKMRADTERVENRRKRGPLTRDRIRESADSCFVHVDSGLDKINFD